MTAVYVSTVITGGELKRAPSPPVGSIGARFQLADTPISFYITAESAKQWIAELSTIITEESN